MDAQKTTHLRLCEEKKIVQLIKHAFFIGKFSVSGLLLAFSLAFPLTFPLNVSFNIKINCYHEKISIINIPPCELRQLGIGLFCTRGVPTVNCTGRGEFSSVYCALSSVYGSCVLCTLDISTLVDGSSSEFFWVFSKN